MFELEFERAKELILKNKAKKTLLQLPDGLKPRSKEIKDFLEKETNTTIFIWAGSNFGACDYPNHVKNYGIDMLISFGHSEWN